jgi:anti-sigma regulatory factor (Ser/Thr protein kinase)
MRPHHTAPPQPTGDASASGASRGGLFGPFELTLAAALDAPAAAKAAMTAWMAGHVGEATLADAQLLVVELVANSVRHADAPGDPVVSVRAGIRGDALRLEVVDRGTSGSIARRAPDMQDGGGFGLNLVESLARRWGIDRVAGTRVWADIGIRGSTSTARAPAGGARRRAVARRAADKAAAEYAHSAHSRVAELHAR